MVRKEIVRLHLQVYECVSVRVYVVYWLGIQWAPRSPNLITLVAVLIFFIQNRIVIYSMCKNFLNYSHLFRQICVCMCLCLCVCVCARVCMCFTQIIHISFQMLWNTFLLSIYFVIIIFGGRVDFSRLIYFNFSLILGRRPSTLNVYYFAAWPSERKTICVDRNL